MPNSPLTDERLAEIKKGCDSLGWDQHFFKTLVAELLAEVQRLRSVEAELRKDAARLDWLCRSEAYMAHSKDGEDCHLVWLFNSLDEEDGSTRIQGGSFSSHRASIDAALQAESSGGAR